MHLHSINKVQLSLSNAFSASKYATNVLFLLCIRSLELVNLNPRSCVRSKRSFFLFFLDLLFSAEGGDVRSLFLEVLTPKGVASATLQLRVYFNLICKFQIYIIYDYYILTIGVTYNTKIK